ncbi:hypothetical protein THRCLA_12201 [Thraustotheca clavata]|uniref:EF-hand domain-containing protein n=1 Tax=Thraustotheca clavata TaxID=74557 RepID=A0A1W0AAZ8_9STRA|nr:hypothetical protein THRCLA_12201 [Thraustotheca clavata]
MSDNPATFLFSVEEAREITGLDLFSTEELFAIFEAELDEKQVLTRDKYNACFRLIVKKKYDQPPAEALRIKTVINRLFDSLASESDAIEFRALACGISVFSADPQDIKVQAAFKLYDTNGDGVISLEEMTNYFTAVFSVLFALDPMRQVAMGGIPSTDLAVMTAQQAFADADKDGNGELSFDEFKECIFRLILILIYMGCASSSLQHELKGLQEAEKANKEEILKLQDERRMLQYKISVMEDMVATAHLEAQEKSLIAAKSEERMKAMKWELVRQSLPNSPRQPISWELKEGSLRHASEIHRVNSPTLSTLKHEMKQVIEQPSSTIPIPKSIEQHDAVFDTVGTFSSKSTSRASSFEKKSKAEITEKPILSRMSSSSEMAVESSVPMTKKSSKSSMSSEMAQDRVHSIKFTKSATKNVVKNLRESKDEPESESDDMIKDLGDSDDLESNTSSVQRK